ncbi:MAG: four helix bundle protein [Phycisphaeraceae bacterium]|nr:four helix bundle protein [Phycisphaeraceae bacterium]MBX3367295.1 four helix bundle protein [Phycisphaeraceae bacterium]MCW5767133.1 four helix bundle protein [Phycisphaeraceae bacterium]QYK49355.1 MAG: four helix bundle protein [Phycisphaeraceae bacterium]
MGDIRSHRDLRAWQLAYALGLQVYRVTSTFPTTERYGLVSQLRRSAISVPSNIAEGFGRGSTHDYIRFLKMARASLFELDTQLQFARDLQLIPQTEFDRLTSDWNDTSKVLAGLIRSVTPNA